MSQNLFFQEQKPRGQYGNGIDAAKRADSQRRQQHYLSIEDRLDQITDAIVTLAERINEITAVPEPQDDDPLLSATALSRRLGLSYSTWRRYRKIPGFPLPTQIAGAHPRWRVSVIDAWLAEQQEQQGAQS